MATYFVSPPEHPDWGDDPEAFADELRRRWPDASVKPTPDDDTFALEFSIERSEGTLYRTGHTVTVDGDVHLAADVAAWWRARVPAEVELLFFDEGYTADVPVEPGTDAAGLASAYLAAAGSA